MSQNTIFQGLLSNVFERRKSGALPNDKRSINELCETLMSDRGEASGIQTAYTIFRKYDGLSKAKKLEFFQFLNDNFDIDTDDIVKAANKYADEASAKNLQHLKQVSNPRRIRLFRRLNSAPGGTERLVRMREDLLQLTLEHPELRRTDSDFEQLFASWFNRGFLVMRHITWQTPAHILEKVISYEAVHAIDSWYDLRRRLLPEDRRCFAFFHPAMPDEPLIFVEVALTKNIPGSIQDVLAEERDTIADTSATTAVFYSISNCQKGLKGISFGNFLIKQVASDLSRDLPNLKTFVTLSPIPGLMAWIRQTENIEISNPQVAELLEKTNLSQPVNDLSQLSDQEANIVQLAIHYLTREKRHDGLPLDPVCRFHLGNGASIRQINWKGDISSKGLKQSSGVMVNYLYDLDEVEANHEAYAQNQTIAVHKSVQRNLK